MVAPAWGHALEKATKLVVTFPAAVLTTTTPFSSTKSFTLVSWDVRLMVRMTLLVGVVFAGGLVFVLELLLEAGVPSSLEQACIIQLMQVSVNPPVMLLMNVFRFM